jgi:hypothetical protein
MDDREGRMTTQHAFALPAAEVRAKPVVRTGDAHHVATEALSRAIAASGIAGRHLARAMGCDEKLIRGMGAGVRPCTWQRLYHAPIALRRHLAAELLHDGVAPSADVASGLRLATHRLGLAASVVELALSPMGPGGSAITAEESVDLLRACAAVRMAVESLEAAARKVGR